MSEETRCLLVWAPRASAVACADGPAGLACVREAGRQAKCHQLYRV